MIIQIGGESMNEETLKIIIKDYKEKISSQIDKDILAIQNKDAEIKFIIENDKSLSRKDINNLNRSRLGLFYSSDEYKKLITEIDEFLLEIGYPNSIREVNSVNKEQQKIALYNFLDKVLRKQLYGLDY